MPETGAAWLTVSWTSEGLTINVAGLVGRWPVPDPPAQPRPAEPAVAIDAVAEPFTIEVRWPEMVTYWEGDEGFMFFGAWGVTPHVLVVPSAAVWDRVMPEWLHGRREVVLERLVERTGHVIDDDRDSFYLVAPDSHLQHR